MMLSYLAGFLLSCREKFLDKGLFPDGLLDLIHFSLLTRDETLEQSCFECFYFLFCLF